MIQFPACLEAVISIRFARGLLAGLRIPQNALHVNPKTPNVWAEQPAQADTVRVRDFFFWPVLSSR